MEHAGLQNHVARPTTSVGHSRDLPGAWQGREMI